jgi:type I restriction enzyme S subunit
MAADWITVTAGQLATERSGSVDPSKFPDELFDLYSIPSYDTGEPEVLAGREIGSSKKIVSPGEILISKIVPHIRRVWIVGPDRGRRQIASSEWISFRGEQVHPEYLRFFLLSDSFHSKFMGTVTGVGGSLLRARPSEVYKIQIPLPPLATQRHIAKVLEQADCLRRQAQQMETELDRLAQALFLEMFPETTRVDGQSTDPLGTHIVFLTSGSRGWAEFYTDRGAIFIRSLDVRMNELNTNEVAYVAPPCSAESRRTKVEAGDVLLTITGSCIGRVCEVPSGLGEAYISQHVSLIRLESSLNPTFLSFFLSLPFGGQLQISKMQYGQTKPGLNLEQIRSLQIPAVSIDRQKQFVAALQKIEAQRQMARRQQAELEQAFQSLMQRAFKGELTPKLA